MLAHSIVTMMPKIESCSAIEGFTLGQLDLSGARIATGDVITKPISNRNVTLTA